MDIVNSSAAFLIASDQQELWASVNNTATDVPSTTLGELFLRQARRNPGHVAVTAARRTLTYEELARSAGEVASHLSNGDHDGTVGICVEPGWEQVVAVMGALLAGVPFHAVDPGQIGSDLGRRAGRAARVVLTQSWLADSAGWPEDTMRVAVDALAPVPGAATVVASDVGPESIACLLATDAAGGAAARVTHDALINTITDLADRFDLGEGDRLLAIAPLGDEVALSSILCPLLTGGTVVIADGVDSHRPTAWPAVVNRERVTVWHSTPTLAVLLAEQTMLGGEPPRTLRLALLGGEPLAASLTDRLRRLAGPRLRVAHLGAYASAGLWVTVHEPDEPDPRRGHVPIGVPLANKHVYVLSDALTPCPVWVAGRLYIGGRGLPSDLADALSPHGEPLQRTEMTGRLLPDGAIDLIGDDTARISMHGHLLNLHEVEGALSTHPDVLAAAVVPAGEGSTAYVKAVPGAEVTGAQLLDHLRRNMSPYLLPAGVELMDALPLTPGGRIDRAALTATADPGADVTAEATPVAVAPADLIERACALAARILDVPEVAPTANLLDFGATSVQLVRLAALAEEELGVRVEVDQLLAFPSVSVLVSFAGTETASATDGQAPSTGGLILDPVERMAFKDRQPGIRRDLGMSPEIPLAHGADDRDRLARRRTRRTFAADPVTGGALASLLGSLRRLEPGEPRYAYPSAGGLYPVQVYLTIVDGRVENLPAGAHYYHPGEHRLIFLDPVAVVDPSAHAWINRDAFRSSGFAVYLVADYSAIEPMYGERARDYCLIEAGAMCQLLMTTAAELDVGLCPVGEMDVTQLRDQLRLGKHHEVLHLLLGGAVADASQGERAQAEMLRRVENLEPGVSPSGLR